MPLDRRQLLVRSGLALVAAGHADLLRAAPAAAAAAPSWAQVRAQFNLSPEWIHMGGLLLVSHPGPVRAAIAGHRRGLDRNPVHYLEKWPALESAVLAEAAGYMGADPLDIALTESTTVGLALVYNGMRLRPGDDVVTTTHDHRVTYESLRIAARRTGAAVRQIPLYRGGAAATEAEIVGAVRNGVRPRTRVLALTWVHSSTGVKLPIAKIAATARRISPEILVCVDGVHGLGVDSTPIPQLGCDVFVAGCHKWLFGPRGTGVVWANDRAWQALDPSVPSYGGSSPAAVFTPGGFHSFEHRWALAPAFAFHRQIGKERVAARIHALARRVKEGLSRMDHVTLQTPRSSDLSAGIVCFEVRGFTPPQVVERLRARRIVATVSPYAVSYARLAPGLLNTPSQVDAALAAIRSLR